MKRLIALLLAAALSLSLAACGGSNSIELTLENYEDYLTINPYGSQSGDEIWLSTTYGSTLRWHSEIQCGAKIEGTSTNFNYENVVIELELYGTYEANEKNEMSIIDDRHSVDKNYDITVTIETDVSGNGDSSEIIELEDNFYTDTPNFTPNYKVISISGTVSKS